METILEKQEGPGRSEDVKTLNVRLPLDLHTRLKQTAVRQRRSLAAQLLQTLDEHLDSLDIQRQGP